MKYSLKLAALALASLAALSQSASAITVATGDLILDVYQTNANAAGYGTVYAADLGNIATFNFSTQNQSFANLVSSTDIGSLFGGAAGLSTVDFDVVADTTAKQTNNSTLISGGNVYNGAILITDANATAVSKNSVGGSTLPAITGNYTTIGNQTAYSSNSAAAVTLAENVPNGSPSQWGIATQGATEFSYASTANLALLDPFGPTTGFPTPPASNGTNTGSVANIGTFAFVNGTFTYDPTAAPEPSTYALMGLGALVLVAAARRRNASNV